jgi:hypothetical protein
VCRLRVILRYRHGEPICMRALVYLLGYSFELGDHRQILSLFIVLGGLSESALDRPWFVSKLVNIYLSIHSLQ